MAARERLTRGSTPKHTRGPNRPSFEPGRAKTGGRTAGTPNRLTLDVKQAILAGFSADAADGKGPIPPGLAARRGGSSTRTPALRRCFFVH